MSHIWGVGTTQVVQISKQQYERFLALEEELAQLKRLVFGKKNERFLPSDTSQTHLDFGDETAEAEVPAAPTEQISYTRQKKSGKQKAVRLALPAHLPRQEEVLEPEEKQQDAVKIGQLVTELLEYRPGKIYVRRIVRPKYVQSPSVSADSSADAPARQIIKAPLPSLPIPGGNVGPGLLAYLLISKYVDHLPFYRQVQIFKREGLKLAESTVNGWFRAVCKLMEPLYYELRKQVLASGYIMADETPIPVQSSHKPGATHTGYLWVYRSVSGLVVFDYQKSRGAQGPQDFLASYQGVLQTDGYAGYDKFAKKPGIRLLACMAHARRKFEQALANDKASAEHALLQFQKLYQIERRCKEEGLSPEAIQQLRQQEAIPLLQQLHQWMQEQYVKVAPKSSIGKALAYSLKLWDRLTGYTENGSWHIDNNLVENSIRPVALGRKNYLFAGSHDAAKWAAMLYSLLGTCKNLEVAPFEWLKTTIERLPDTKITELSSLLPAKR